MPAAFMIPVKHAFASDHPPPSPLRVVSVPSNDAGPDGSRFRARRRWAVVCVASTLLFGCERGGRGAPPSWRSGNDQRPYFVTGDVDLVRQYLSPDSVTIVHNGLAFRHLAGPPSDLNTDYLLKIDVVRGGPELAAVSESVRSLSPSGAVFLVIGRDSSLVRDAPGAK